MSIEGVSAKVNLSEEQPLWRKTLREYSSEVAQASANFYPSGPRWSPPAGGEELQHTGQQA